MVNLCDVHFTIDNNNLKKKILEGKHLLIGLTHDVGGH